MASAASQLTAISGVAPILDRLFGNSSTTSGTNTSSSTTQQDISPEGLTRIINQMLSGQGGVKDISGAARGAGLYNSSTEALLRNDLATRVAGEAAKLSAPTTSSKTDTVDQTTSTPSILSGSNLLKAGLGLLATSAGKGVLGAITGNGSSGGIGGVISNLFGGGSGATQPLALAQSIEGNAGTAVSQNFAAPITSALEGLTNNSLSGAGDVLAGSLGSAGDFASSSFSAPISQAASSAGGLAGGMTGPVGGILSGLVSGNNPNDFSGISLATSALGGLATMGPPGLVLGPAFSVLGNGLGEALKSVVCTALMKLDLLDKAEYKLGQNYLNRLSPNTILGYYIWGVPLAMKIEAKSPWAIALTLPFAASRMHLLAAMEYGPKTKIAKFNNYLSYPLGTLTKFVGEPLCWLLGKSIQVSKAIGRIHYGSN